MTHQRSKGHTRENQRGHYNTMSCNVLYSIVLQVLILYIYRRRVASHSPSNTVGCLRRADFGLVFKNQVKPKNEPILVSKECAKSRA